MRERITSVDLKTFFTENNKVALAFSGGVDSAYLLYAAIQNGADVTAYYVKSAFQPQFELDDAKRLADGLGAKIKIIHADVLANDDVVKNPANRCYYCKKIIFSLILKAAAEDGYSVIIDGTNASDDVGDRPGIKALREMEVKSPLQLCGLTKDMIRDLSKKAGLFTWDKPSYACLATRIPTGEIITEEKLSATERSEEFLSSLGFRDFRIRRAGGAAKLQIPAGQIDRVIKNREKIVEQLKKDYSSVLLDLEVRNEQ